MEQFLRNPSPADFGQSVFQVAVINTSFCYTQTARKVLLLSIGGYTTTSVRTQQILTYALVGVAYKKDKSARSQWAAVCR